MKIIYLITFSYFFFISTVFSKNIDDLIEKNVNVFFPDGSSCSYSFHNNNEVKSECIIEDIMKYQIIDSTDLRYIIFGPTTNQKGSSASYAIFYDPKDNATIRFAMKVNREDSKWRTFSPKVEISEIINNTNSSNDGEDGKVVFKINNAVDYFESFDRRDDFDEFTHYDNVAGCKYNIEVKNNTIGKIKINMFKISTNNKKLFSDKMRRNRLVQFMQVIEPGDSYTGIGDYQVDGPYMKVGKTEELPSDEYIKQAIAKYGCEAQKGSIFIKTADMGQPDISFSKELGIADNEKSNFIIGSNDGYFPLKKDIQLN